MKRTVLIRPEAAADLAAARDWYEDRLAGLGVEFGSFYGVNAEKLNSGIQR